jgi:YbbR domain-containing protein
MIAFLRDLFFKDTALKIFSLVLAIMTWLVLSSFQRGLTTSSNAGLYYGKLSFFNVEVVVLSSASDVHDYRVEPKTVEVIVEGDAKVIQKLESKDVRAMVDLTGFQGGADVRKRIEVSTPAGVSHVRVNPSEVRVVYPSRH